MSDRLSTIVAIHIGKSKERLRAVSVVSAAPGKGLEGDRYSDGTGTFYKPNCPDREVTLIETEALEALKRDYGIELAPSQTRRNLLTEWFHLESNKIKTIYASMFYPAPEAPAPNWPPFDPNWQITPPPAALAPPSPPARGAQ